MPGLTKKGTSAAASGRLRSQTQQSARRHHVANAGLRMHEQRSAAALQEFVLDEALRLTRALRLLLVLDVPGGMQLAGARLPRRESAATLLTAVTPWLDDVRGTRTARLRHGPDGAEPSAQRSCLVAPLIAQRELLGFLYADVDGTVGRFDHADRALFAMLASQAAGALAHIRTVEGLTGKLAERTAQLDQRAGELALINSIQQGMAAKVSFQGSVTTGRAAQRGRRARPSARGRWRWGPAASAR